MDCKRASILMMDYFDGMMKDKDREALLKHMEQCDACSLEYSLMREALEAVEAIEDSEPPEAIENLVMAQIDTERYHKRSRATKLKWGLGLLLPILLIIAMGYFISIPGNRVSPDLLKEELISVLISFASFTTVTLPKVMDAIGRIVGFIFNIPLVFFIGIGTLLLVLVSVEICFVRLFKLDKEGYYAK